MNASENSMRQARTWQVTGLAIAICGMMLLSTKPILIKLAYEQHATASTVLYLRMLFSLPFYLLVCILALSRKKTFPSRRDLLQASLIGILAYYISYYLDLLGLERISAQLERLILFCYPTVVVVTMAFVSRKMPRMKILLALALTYFGLFLLFGRDVRIGGHDTAVGSALVFAGAVVFASCIVASRPVIARMGSLLFTSVAMIAACVVTLFHFGLAGAFRQLPGIETGAIWIVLWMTIFTTILPSFMFAEAVARFGPEPASVIFGAGPIVTSLLAVFVLGETFTWFHFGGIGLAIVGIILLNLGEQYPSGIPKPPGA